MPSLQIRNLPDDVYQSLAFRAEQEHRSLAQQAIVELRKTTTETVRGQRRKQVLEDLKRAIKEQNHLRLSAPPEDLIRDDRDR